MSATSNYYVILSGQIVDHLDGVSRDDARSAANRVKGYAIECSVHDARVQVSANLAVSLEGLDDDLNAQPAEVIANPAIIAAAAARDEWVTLGRKDRSAASKAALQAVVRVLTFEQGRPGTVSKAGQVLDDSLAYGIVELQGRTKRDFGLDVSQATDEAGFTWARQHFCICLAAHLAVSPNYRRSELSVQNMKTYSKLV